MNKPNNGTLSLFIIDKELSTFPNYQNPKEKNSFKIKKIKRKSFLKILIILKEIKVATTKTCTPIKPLETSPNLNMKNLLYRQMPSPNLKKASKCPKY